MFELFWNLYQSTVVPPPESGKTIRSNGNNNIQIRANTILPQTTGVFQRGSRRILLFSDYLRCCGLTLGADSIAITERELWMVNEQTSGQV